ncbi:MAG: response regulator transcription factor [Longimicrobiales bacterium]
MANILLIEDSPDLAFGLRNNLEFEGHEVDVAPDGSQGLTKARDSRPDLIILDLMIPGIDGYRVLKSLREDGVLTPVLILSARSEEADKLRGFRMGADDYVTKPFSLLELIARVEALLRRSVSTDFTPDLLRFGDLAIDQAAQIVFRHDHPVTLRPREFDLLMALVNRRGRVVTRLDLLREVWGHRNAISTRTVDAHIAELRRKIEEDPAEPRFIATVMKSGYRFDAGDRGEEKIHGGNAGKDEVREVP